MRDFLKTAMMCGAVYVAYFVGFDKGVHQGLCGMAREFRAQGTVSWRVPARACEPWEFLKVDGKDIEPDVHCTGGNGFYTCTGPISANPHIIMEDK